MARGAEPAAGPIRADPVRRQHDEIAVVVVGEPDDLRGAGAIAHDRLAADPVCVERRAQLGDTLSGGEQQMLAVGRALVTGGELVLLDEPSMGLAPILVQEIFQILREINERGITVLLVEQNARQALKLASRAYVLETGRIVLSGPAAELAENPKVQEAYLGG